MNTRAHIAVVTTFLAVACADEHAQEPSSFERLAQPETVLTSTVTSVAPTAPPPEPADVSAPAEADEPIDEQPVEQGEDILIRRLMTAPAIADREPRLVTSVFGDDQDKVYAFLEVANGTSEDQVLTVNFIAPSGNVTGGVELTIPASTPRWRTWAYTRFADELGLWRVEVRSATGELLGTVPFEVAEGC